MTRIRATCPRCGEVELPAAEVELHVVRAPDGQLASGTHYAFDCPECGERVRKDADERICQLLTGSGVNVRVTPAARHPESPPDGPPLTVDDLIDLHLLLQREDWFEMLLAACR